MDGKDGDGDLKKQTLSTIQSDRKLLQDSMTMRVRYGWALIAILAALVMAVALPAFLLAMYEKDGLPLEKVVGNIIRARFLRPGIRPYQTQNIYAPFTQRGAAGKEDAIENGKRPKARPRKGR